jgi:uncharacterized protein
MELKAKLQSDLKDAMRAQDALKLSTLRGLIAEIKKREIDKRAVLDEPEIHKVIQSLLKQRADSIEAFRSAGREELALKEELEVTILKVYLPAQLSKEEIEVLVVAAITETGATKPSDIGNVMKAVLAKSAGRADGKWVNEIARMKLASR